MVDVAEIGITVDSSDLTRGTRELDKFNRAAKTTETATTRLNRSMRTSAVGFNQLRGAIGGLAAVMAARQVATYADSWTRLTNQLKQTNDTAGQVANRQKQLVDIAIATQTPLETIATLYARMRTATKDFGASQSEALLATQTLSKRFASAGLSAGEISSAVIQLSQGLGAGALRGDELNSVLENARPLAAAIAKEFGVAVGDLKTLGEQGKLVSSRVFKAILSDANAANDAFSKATTTLAGGWTAINTAVTAFVGRLDEATGISAAIAGYLKSAAEYLNQFNTSDFAARWSIITQTGNTTPLDAGAMSIETIQQRLASARTLLTAWSSGVFGALDFMTGGVAHLTREIEILSAALEAKKANLTEFMRIGRAFDAPGLANTDTIKGTVTSLGGAAGTGLKYTPPPSRAPLATGTGTTKLNEYQQEIKAIKDKTEATRLDAQTTGWAESAAAKWRATEELLNAAMQAKIKITPVLQKEINDLSTAYAQQVQAAENAQKSIERLDEYRSLASGTFSGMWSDIRSGASALDVISNSFDRFTDKLVAFAENQAWNALLGQQGTAGGGLLGSLLGFGTSTPAPVAAPVRAARGGLIRGGGSGTSDSIPAWLSNGEYVVNARATSQNRALLDKINGYASGGPVRRSQTSGGSANVEVNLIGMPSGYNVESKKTSSRADGGTKIDLVLKRMVEQVFTNDVENYGPMFQSMERKGLRRT